MGKAEVLYEKVVRAIPEEVRQGEVNESKGHQEITCHIIFDAKVTLRARHAM